MFSLVARTELTKKDLSVAMSFVNGTEIQTGISFHFIVRKILEDCENTKQVIELIQKAKVSSANNFLIADKNGEIVVVESTPQKSIVRRPQKNEQFIYITNEFKSKEMQTFDRGGVEWSKSTERYNGLKEQFKVC